MYHKIKHHVRHHTRKHQTLILTIIIIAVAGFVGGAINDYYSSRQVSNSFQKNFEKTSLAQLSTYDYGLNSAFTKSFESISDAMTNIAGSNLTLQSVRDKNYKALQKTLTALIDIEPRLDTVSLLDARGTLLMIASHQPTAQKFVGTNFAQRDYYQQTVKTKKPVISDIVPAITNRNVLVFTAPVLDNSGHLVAIVRAGISLDEIYKNLKQPTAFLDGLSFVLTDSKGNIIINERGAPNSIINIKADEPSLTAFQSAIKSAGKSEINYLNQKVFALASSLPVANSNYYLVSFYNQNTYNHNLSVIKSEYNTTLLEQRIRNIIMMIIVLAIYYRVVKNREKDL